MTDRSSRGGVAPWPTHPIITIERAHHSIGAGVGFTGSSAAASGTSPFSSANDMNAFPFVLHATTPIFKAWTYVGPFPASFKNFSIGIYDADYNLCAQTASTSDGTTGDVPVAATLTTKLSAGLYYAAMAADNTTSGEYYRWSIPTTGALFWKMMGCWKQASVTLGALPNPATPVAYTNIAFPYFGLLTRSNFDL